MQHMRPETAQESENAALFQVDCTGFAGRRLDLALGASRDSSFAMVSWIARFAAPAGAIFLSIRLLGVSRDLSLRKKLKSIPPTSDTVCPFCAVRLMAATSSRFSCPACQIVRY
jgi:hypothetical protein